MFIFRTTLVNTVIVIILSTNVIQFYCVTSECGVFFFSSFRYYFTSCFYIKKVYIIILQFCADERELTKNPLEV